jgi:hypothetical protein
MDHLENIRNDTARHRGGRMVLGLGAFMEGQATMDTYVGSVASAKETSSQPFGASLHRPAFKGITITELDPRALRNTMTRAGSSNPDDEHTGVSESTAADSLQQDRHDLPGAVGQASTSATPSTSASKGRKSNDITASADLGVISPSLAPTDQSSIPLEAGQTFARAANILRQCTASDGVMFFDAQSANVDTGNRAAATYFNGDSHDENTSSDDVMSSSGGSSDSLGEHEKGYFTRRSPKHEQPKGYRKQSNAKKCEMIGCSFRLSSVAKLNNSSSGLILREVEMSRIIRRYPKVSSVG